LDIGGVPLKGKEKEEKAQLGRGTVGQVRKKKKGKKIPAQKKKPQRTHTGCGGGGEGNTV